MAESPHIVLTRADHVLEVEISRRDKKNALTADMYAALSDALLMADADPAIHVVLLHGQPDLFCAGNDVADFLDPAVRSRMEAPRFTRTLAGTKTPIVAAVGGIAIGVGATMLLHCDVVLAADDARLQFPFVSLGLCPEAASSLILPQMAGHRAAAELMLFGDFFTAERGREIGMITEVVPSNALFDRARHLAQRLAAQPHDALLTTKALLRRPPGRPTLEVMDEEFAEFGRLLQSEEAKKIFATFLARRSPA